MHPVLAAIFLLIALPGCSYQSSGTSDMLVVSGVPPFEEQLRKDDCGSVALASLLAHAGHPVPAKRIDQEVYDPILKGTLLPDLENFAVKEGALPKSGRGDLNTLRSLLAAGKPILLPIDLGWAAWRRPHYVVVFGYGDQGFLMFQRQGEPSQISAAELDRRWRKLGHLYLYLQ